MYYWIITLRRALKQPEARGAARSAVLLLATGTVFYCLVEKWSVVDSIYFCVTTLTTVGFGQPAPATAAGKLFTTFFVLSGVGMFLAVINAIGRAAVKTSVESTGRRRGRSDEAAAVIDQYSEPPEPDFSGPGDQPR